MQTSRKELIDQSDNFSRCMILFVCTIVIFLINGCQKNEIEISSQANSYSKITSGTRQFEWDTDNDIGWIRVLVEEFNLDDEVVEIGEIYFPSDYEGMAHVHELEILYVLEGELDHIVNGISHILKPGMIGIVRAPDNVVHRTNSLEGTRVLAIWPHGNEVAAMAEEGMREMMLE
tara:strand:- start:5550 stop:6074 length:525 start_codon:yes stop_codon:yes gene_type:complete